MVRVRAKVRVRVGLSMHLVDEVWSPIQTRHVGRMRLIQTNETYGRDISDEWVMVILHTAGMQLLTWECNLAGSAT